MTTNNTNGDSKYTTAITQAEIDSYIQQIEIQKQYAMSQGLWPGNNTIWGAVQSFPFKEVKTGGEQILETRCSHQELKDYFVLGNVPQEGHTYNLVCVKVTDENGQIVARFKLV